MCYLLGFFFSLFGHRLPLVGKSKPFRMSLCALEVPVNLRHLKITFFWLNPVVWPVRNFPCFEVLTSPVCSSPTHGMWVSCMWIQKTLQAAKLLLLVTILFCSMNLSGLTRCAYDYVAVLGPWVGWVEMWLHWQTGAAALCPTYTSLLIWMSRQ